MLQFYAYRLAVREKFALHQYGQRLFHQYIVDAYTKIEAQRLLYIKTHQKELMADKYQGVMDYLNNQAILTDSDIGRTVILPSSFGV